MTLAAFRATLGNAAPSADLNGPLRALWWAGKGDWDQAHRIVMDDASRDAAWVHAYLHRVEGDLGNARYWYREAEKPAASGPLPAEWDAITRAMLAS